MIFRQKDVQPNWQLKTKIIDTHKRIPRTWVVAVTVKQSDEYLQTKKNIDSFVVVVHSTCNIGCLIVQFSLDGL